MREIIQSVSLSQSEIPQGQSRLHTRDWKYTHVIDAIYRTMMHKSNKKAAFELIVSAGTGHISVSVLRLRKLLYNSYITSN